MLRLSAAFWPAHMRPFARPRASCILKNHSRSSSVQYVLTNSAGNAVGACLDGWDNFHLIGSRGNRGGIHVSTAVALDDVVRLAPGTSLVWTREVEVPDVGLGKAQFIGIVESRCWLWSGRVMSRPVEIEIVGAS